MTFALVSSDMAGTTFDEGSTVYKVLQRVVAEAAGTEVSWDLVENWTGTSKQAAVAGLLKDVGSDADPDAVFDTFQSELTKAYTENPPKPFAGVEELFMRLRAQGVKIALQTGYNRPVAETILQNAGWVVGETIDALVTSDEVAQSRPAPYMIFKCMERTGVLDVKDVLVIGDTPNDVEAGSNAGAGYVCGVLSGAHPREELEQHRHTHLVNSITEIEQFLQ